MTKEDFLDLLDELGDRLSGPAERLFELAVQRVVTGRIVTLVVLVMVVAGALGFWRYVKAMHKTRWADYTDRVTKWEKMKEQSDAERQLVIESAQEADDWREYNRLYRYSSLQFGHPSPPDFYQWDAARWALLGLAALAVLLFGVPAVVDLLNPEWAALGEIAKEIR